MGGTVLGAHRNYWSRVPAPGIDPDATSTTAADTNRPRATRTSPSATRHGTHIHAGRPAFLHDRLGPHRPHRVGQADKAVTDHDAHVPHPAVLDLGQHVQPVLGPLTAVAG